MPNHVTTKCVVRGPKKDRDAFFLLMFPCPKDKEELQFDFKKIIPMPEGLDVEASSDVDDGLRILGWGHIIDNQFMPKTLADMLEYPWVKAEGITTAYDFAYYIMKRSPDCITKAMQAIENYKAHGFVNWYDWSVINWGTKWNAYQVEVTASTAAAFNFSFQTAWAFPEPIFRALAQKFPTLVFQCTSFDEGWNFACIGEFNGRNDFKQVAATAAIYEEVYGEIWTEEEAED